MESRFPLPPPILRSAVTIGPSSLIYDNSYQVSYTIPSGVVEIHSVEQLNSCFVASAENNKLLVIEFTAAWCIPCKKIEPVMQELAAQYTDVEFIKIDVDAYPPVAQKFEVGSLLPCFALVKKWAMVDKVEGFKQTELQSKIGEHRAPLFDKHSTPSTWY